MVISCVNDAVYTWDLGLGLEYGGGAISQPLRLMSGPRVESCGDGGGKYGRAAWDNVDVSN